MTITVYSVSGAPRAWRLLAGLAFKQLDYNIKLLDFSKGEHKSLAFLAINPRGTVPVLTDGSTIIRDSMAGLLWLDRAYPERPIFGTTSPESAEILQASFEVADYLRAATSDLLEPVFFGGVTTKTPELEEAAQNMKEEIFKLETLLGEKPFLMGDKPTAVDAIAYPEIRIVQRAILTKTALMSDLGFGDLQSLFPGIADWEIRVSELPGMEKTYPPHWHKAA
ncbi:MAG: glutathione S-transferase family protein [Sneathiella sp.]